MGSIYDECSYIIMPHIAIVEISVSILVKIQFSVNSAYMHIHTVCCSMCLAKHGACGGVLACKFRKFVVNTDVWTCNINRLTDKRNSCPRYILELHVWNFAFQPDILQTGIQLGLRDLLYHEPLHCKKYCASYLYAFSYWPIFTVALVV